MIDIEMIGLAVVSMGSGIIGTLVYIGKRYSKREIMDIALKIHNARTEASDEGTKMTDVEALDIIDDIIVAYLE